MWKSTYMNAPEDQKSKKSRFPKIFKKNETIKLSTWSEMTQDRSMSLQNPYTCLKKHKILQKTDMHFVPHIPMWSRCLLFYCLRFCNAKRCPLMVKKWACLMPGVDFWVVKMRSKWWLFGKVRTSSWTRTYRTMLHVGGSRELQKWDRTHMTIWWNVGWEHIKQKLCNLVRKSEIAGGARRNARGHGGVGG